MFKDLREIDRLSIGNALGNRSKRLFQVINHPKIPHEVLYIHYFYCHWNETGISTCPTSQFRQATCQVFWRHLGLEAPLRGSMAVRPSPANSTHGTSLDPSGPGLGPVGCL